MAFELSRNPYLSPGANKKVAKLEAIWYAVSAYWCFSPPVGYKRLGSDQQFTLLRTEPAWARRYSL
jgi:hypothetical protein